MLTKEAAQPIQAPPHYRSTQQGLKSPGEGKSFKYDEPMGFIGKSFIMYLGFHMIYILGSHLRTR